ncbi:ATP-NAD kinase-like domain-containing protein, partial [Trichophaea hybrida]
TISADTLICVLPTDYPHTYTLVHQIPSTELIQTPISHPPSALLTRLLLRNLPTHLSPQTAETTILVSTASGGRHATSFHDKILSPLCNALDLSPEVIHTTSPSTIVETVIRLSQRSRPQTLILLSGDTVVCEAINAIPPTPSTRLTIAVLPLGTGNGLATSYHIARGIPPFYALLFGTPKPLPVYSATLPPGTKWVSARRGDGDTIKGVVVASWGFHAALVADAELLRGDGVGAERFLTAAKENLKPSMHRYKGEVAYLPKGGGEWKVLSGEEHFYVLATLCANLDEKFRISPGSVPGAKVMRVVYFTDVEKGEEVMEIMGKAFKDGEHVVDRRVWYEEVEGIRIKMEEREEKWRRVCLDGAIAVLPEGGTMEV